MEKIALFNNKGGVAKTTSVINIAYNMHKKDLKVLVVDCDTQENCFEFFLAERAEGVLPTKYANISHTKWRSYEALSETEREGFDYILFDMPPALSDEVLEIIKKADSVYVPMMLGRFELNGLMNVLDICADNLGGTFVTMYDKEAEPLYTKFKNALGTKMLDHVIPFSKTVRTSQLYGMPLEEYFIENGVPKHLKSAWKVVDAYEALTDEIIGGEN